MPRRTLQILTVDDDPVTCELLCEVFTREGFGASFEHSGEAVTDTPPLSADDLAQLFSGLPSLDEIERRYILHVLDATGSNRKRTAEILGINRKTLYRMAARFEIELGLVSSRTG
ncbi:MAG: helix-turn-helix domain-containing protein [Pyrinomonadaceae bacterium]